MPSVFRRFANHRRTAFLFATKRKDVRRMDAGSYPLCWFFELPLQSLCHVSCFDQGHSGRPLTHSGVHCNES